MHETIALAERQVAVLFEACPRSVCARTTELFGWKEPRGPMRDIVQALRART